MKRFLCFLAALCLLAVMAVPAYAATTEENIIDLSSPRSIVIWVRWDKEQPEVVFLAPDGTQYDPLTEAAGTTTMLSDTNLYYIIENAQAGQWKIRYDKKSNTVLDVSVHDYQEGLLIRSFTHDSIENDRMPVRFTVSGRDGLRYSYRISAMINHTGMEKELLSGSALTGAEQMSTVNLSQLSSYDAYMLKLYVWYNDSGVDISDFAFTEPFSYQNTKADASIPEFGMIVRPEDYLVSVTWSDLGWNAESVLVAIFEDDATEPVVFDEYDPDVRNSVQLGYTPGISKVSVEVSVKRGGVNSAPQRKTAVLAAFSLSLPEGEAFNTLSLPMGYKDMHQQLTNAVVNGYTTELVLEGDGTMNIPLQDDWNTVQVSYTDAGGVTWQISRELFVDRTAPVLNMTQAYDGMQVSTKKLTVSGTALECSTLTINGEMVAVGESGMFSREITLKKGINTLRVVAADALGNESVYTAQITCGKVSQVQNVDGSQDNVPGSLLTKLTAEGSYWVLLLSGVLCVLVIGYALIFWRRRDRQ